DCGKDMSPHASSCPNCGRPKHVPSSPEERAAYFTRTGQLHPDTREEIRQNPYDGRPRCPKCGSYSVKRMDAGERGKAFGGGNVLGAFMNSMRCQACGGLW